MKNLALQLFVTATVIFASVLPVLARGGGGPY